MLKQQDIIADLHSHTIFSKHAISTLKENIEEAKSKGIRYLAVTDHVFYSGNEMENKNESARIKALSRAASVKDLCVISGAELNIGQVNEFINTVIKQYATWRPIGIHGWWFDISASTLDLLYEKFEQAVSSGFCTAIAHPERELFKVNNGEYGKFVGDEIKEYLTKIVLLAKEYNIPLEVNENTIKINEEGALDRLEFWIKIAKKNNCVIYLGSDAHYCDEVGSFENVIRLLNKIKYPKDLIINCSDELLSKYVLQKPIKTGEKRTNSIEYTWDIEMGDENTDPKHFGSFTGTEQTFNVLKEVIETYIDTEAGWNKFFKYTKK